VLFLDESFTYDLVDGRLDEASGNGLTVPVAIGIVGDRLKVGGNVADEFLELVVDDLCPFGFITDIPGQILQRLRRPVWTAVPEVSLGAAQGPQILFYKVRRILRIHGFRCQTFDELADLRRAHGDMKPVQDGLAKLSEISLGLPHRIAAIRQECRWLRRIDTLLG